MEPAKGNYRGTIDFTAEIYSVDEEYEAYLETLTSDELNEELIKAVVDLKAKVDAFEDMNY